MSFKYSYQVGAIWGDVYAGIKRLATIGFDAVEVAGVTSYFRDADKIKKAADAEGMAVSSICTLGFEFDLAFPRKEVREKAISYMYAVIDFAAALNCKRVIVNPTKLGKWTPLAPLADELKWGAEGIAAIADYAKPADIVLCVEAWNRYDTYLINTAAQCRAFIDMVKRENVGVMLDTFHLNIEEVDMAGAILDSRGYLVHLHVGDSNRAAPGMGHTNFVPLLKALKNIDYQGYITMELTPPAADLSIYADMYDMTTFLEEYPKTALKTLKSIETAI
jgi:sugar phosphate isomerase/epimerase